ncbi:MAG: HAD-IIIA family hydrolase [Clostridia bacterium]|nr:HAD-IIIA family hydrolase [Clostridia bacterium]
MKYVFFDLDGTLCDTITDITDSLNRALQAHGYPTFTSEQVKAMVGKSIAYMCQRAMPKGHENDWEIVKQDYFADYSEHLCDKTRPYEGITEAVNALKAKGYTLAVVTNKPHAHAVKIVRELFAHHGDVFSAVQGQAPKFLTKPDPESLLFVMKNLGATQQNSVYIGDSDTDIQFAKNTGIKSIGVSWGYRPVELLKQTGATAIAKSPDTLAALIEELLN